ncbi:hypothetical protein GCM10023322_24140 [Rugosimonospora acidiphila]|uniref:MFS transporter n=1 Tax=Rugosimonospora acidiphila TaxID=556531 RepID=A0ABP9RPU1_9ACTN
MSRRKPVRAVPRSGREPAPAPAIQPGAEPATRPGAEPATRPDAEPARGPGAGRARGLLRGYPDFRRLWIGESVSQFGSQVSMLAVPLTAVLILHAGTFQVSALTALGYAPFLIFGLLAGVWVDRVRRRPVLIAADLLRAVALASVPVAAALQVLGLAQLYAVQFVVGLGTLVFDVAYQSYLPSLIGRQRLVEGNGRMEASRSVAYSVGPSVAGYLVQALTAPVAILADAVSFVWSAAWITAIRGREPAVPAPAAPRALGREIGQGLRLVFGHPALRALALYSAASTMVLSVYNAIEVVFLVRTVGLSAAGVGLLFSAASVGAVLGAFAAGPLCRRFGQARTIVGAGLTGNASMVLVPLTAPGARLAFFGVGVGVCSLCVVIFNVVTVAFRQVLCPDALLGRMNATMRVLSWGTVPVGALIGGALGTALGPRTTLWCGGVGGLLPVLWLLRSPLPRLGGPASPGDPAPGGSASSGGTGSPGCSISPGGPISPVRGSPGGSDVPDGAPTGPGGDALELGKLGFHE